MRNYGTGSRRDSREGKGRYDLISPYATKRLAQRLEFGVEKYGERNWEKGQPMDDFFDSAKRHMDNWQMGMTDEDHLAAAYWNLHCMIHFDSVGMPEAPMMGKCVKCMKANEIFNADWVCIDCIAKEEATETLPSNSLVDSKAPVSPSKPLTPMPKVFVPKASKDGLGGDTERQNIIDAHTKSETAEMIRREEYRDTYRHVFPQVNEQLTLEGLAHYD